MRLRFPGRDAGEQAVTAIAEAIQVQSAGDDHPDEQDKERGEVAIEG